MEKLKPDWYLQDTLSVARALLGKRLCRRTEEGLTVCRITETEAYTGLLDPACHSYRRRSPDGRTNIMYHSGGLAYIYLIYGMYCCFNVVTRPEGEPEAVLIRSAEPLEGLDLMKQRRGTEKDLLTGPGRLCQGMAITRAEYGEPLWGDRLWLEDAEPIAEEKVLTTPRIHVDYAGEAARWPYRFLLKDSPFLSVKPKKK